MRKLVAGRPTLHSPPGGRPVFDSRETKLTEGGLVLITGGLFGLENVTFTGLLLLDCVLENPSEVRVRFGMGLL